MKNNDPIRSLADIFNDPDFQELAPTKPKPRPHASDPDVERFQEIQEWIRQHDGREPESTPDLRRIQERGYANALIGYRAHPEKWARLAPYDELGLLKGVTQDPDLKSEVAQEKQDFDSLDEILSDDSVLFDNNPATLNQKLFDTQKLDAIHREQENRPEAKSNRKRVANFAEYQPMFKTVQADLASGRRTTRPYRSNKVERHHFYVLNGQLLYIESIGAEFVTDTKSNTPVDARVHVIYENGTENYPLRNGLISSLYGSKKRHNYGRTVTEPDDSFQFTAADQSTGYIYVLKSESQNSAIKRLMEHHPLYKVGYTTGSVADRIKNAENESTYLYSPVKQCAQFEVFNLNSEALETAIHHALHRYQVDIDIPAPNGKLIHPREWFAIDLETISAAVNAIVAKLNIS